MHNSNRRQFLVQAAAWSCGPFWSDSPIPKTFSISGVSSAAESRLAGKPLLSKMKWFNEPASAKQSGDQFVVTTKPKTGVAGKYATLYDQAGLMVRIDSSTWLKCGLELVDGIGHASVVVTRNFSDWSTVRGIPTKDPLWWRIVRKGSSLEVLFSLDGRNFTSTRLGYLPLQASVDAGIMCCSPEGTGFESTFDELHLVQ